MFQILLNHVRCAIEFRRVMETILNAVKTKGAVSSCSFLCLHPLQEELQLQPTNIICITRRIFSPFFSHELQQGIHNENSIVFG